jgi:signal transduction histidine kinase
VDDTPDLTVTITDDGQGFEAGTVINKGLGLLGMRARVEALRGEFDVLSQPGQGTKVVARFNSKIVPHGAIHD